MFLPKYLLIMQVAVFGLIIGSFLNVCVYRIPKKLSLMGRSMCPTCGKTIPFYRNVPVLSWLFQRARSACCRKPISVRYPTIEALTGILSVVVLNHSDSLTEYFLWFLLFICPLLTISFIDMELKIIPDVISLPFIPIGVVMQLYLKYPDVFGVLKFSGLGILIGGGTLLLLAEIFTRLKGVEAMGGGDIKLAGMLGAFLGWRALIFVFFSGSCLALVYFVIGRLVRRKNFDPQIPFGPFLSLGAILCHLYGRELSDLYFQASGFIGNPLFD